MNALRRASGAGSLPSAASMAWSTSTPINHGSSAHASRVIVILREEGGDRFPEQLSEAGCHGGSYGTLAVHDAVHVRVGDFHLSSEPGDGALVTGEETEDHCPRPLL